jgi:hypothetical protein
VGDVVGIAALAELLEDGVEERGELDRLAVAPADEGGAAGVPRTAERAEELEALGALRCEVRGGDVHVRAA